MLPSPSLGVTSGGSGDEKSPMSMTARPALARTQRLINRSSERRGIQADPILGYRHGQAACKEDERELGRLGRVMFYCARSNSIVVKGRLAVWSLGWLLVVPGRFNIHSRRRRRPQQRSSSDMFFTVKICLLSSSGCRTCCAYLVVPGPPDRSVLTVEEWHPVKTRHTERIVAKLFG